MFPALSTAVTYTPYTRLSYRLPIRRTPGPASLRPSRCCSGITPTPALDGSTIFPPLVVVLMFSPDTVSVVWPVTTSVTFNHRSTDVLTVVSKLVNALRPFRVQHRDRSTRHKYRRARVVRERRARRRRLNVTRVVHRCRRHCVDSLTPATNTLLPIRTCHVSYAAPDIQCLPLRPRRSSSPSSNCRSAPSPSHPLAPDPRLYRRRRPANTSMSSDADCALFALNGFTCPDNCSRTVVIVAAGRIVQPEKYVLILSADLHAQPDRVAVSAFYRNRVQSR